MALVVYTVYNRITRAPITSGEMESSTELTDDAQKMLWELRTRHEVEELVENEIKYSPIMRRKFKDVRWFVDITY